jgi:hypothetical protein
MDLPEAIRTVLIAQNKDNIWLFLHGTLTKTRKRLQGVLDACYRRHRRQRFFF